MVKHTFTSSSWGSHNRSVWEMAQHLSDLLSGGWYYFSACLVTIRALLLSCFRKHSPPLKGRPGGSSFVISQFSTWTQYFVLLKSINERATTGSELHVSLASSPSLSDSSSGGFGGQWHVLARGYPAKFSTSVESRTDCCCSNPPSPLCELLTVKTKNSQLLLTIRAVWHRFLLESRPSSSICFIKKWFPTAVGIQ